MSSELNLSIEQNRLVEQAASVHNLKNYEIITNVGSLKGDNYLGVLHTITLKSDEKLVYLILKSAHTDDKWRAVGKSQQAFAREGYIYSTIIPKLLKLQEEKGVSDGFSGFAKFYGSCLEEKKECILMQNLKGYGFDLWDRKKPMDDQHITLVFKEYARLHASSLAWKKLYPQEFQEYTKHLNFNIFEGGKEDKTIFFQNYFQTGFSAVESNDQATKALTRIKENITQLFRKSYTEGQERFVVIHGDCWCNNMLFSYQDDQKTPQKVCFIDWQLSKISSPATDLAYFFCVCASKANFHNLTKYLQIYHDQLAKNLKEFGCDPEEVFSYSALLEEWRKRAWYGAFMAISIIKLMLSDPDDAPSLENGENNQHVLQALTNFSSGKSHEHQTRLCDLLVFLDDHQYI